ncbi:AraC family transcriptional regulator [Azoarcus sp. DD4]|uniref:AraC family transcriptional regulator n=1 Tax=Azoarcus sp. DD4 TaxID=2027405 RepID=UPI0011298F9B|nr:AraC family transcriptional regulator [Azoarcus sp. DD4]QDF96251.1 AraC family transcriptional regulator [Azoarcus sp. DD4]
MSPSANLDLTKVYRNCVFQSRSAVASHTQLSRELCGHDLDWRRGNVDTALFRADVNRMSFLALRYGAEVEVRPEPFKDFALVQMPLRGAAEIECDGVRITVAQGEAAVVAPRRHIRLVWQPGCEQLILKVPYELVRQVSCHTCTRSHCPDNAPDCGVGLESAFVLEPALNQQWRALVQQLLNLLPMPGEAGIHPGWLNQFEQTVALFLLAHQPSALARDLRGDEEEAIALSSSERLAGRKLDAVEDYMRSRLFAPISLADLAKAAGVSARTLNILCHRYRGVAPMVLLRNVRLDAARARLVSDPLVSVTEVALEYGFGHLGRFSAYYRERFGELPRDTCMLRH